MNRDEPLTRADIITGALAIIRTEGVDGLTMRRLATQLGCTPMGIYHHIPDRTALLGACMEQVWDDVMHAVVVPGAGGDLVEVIIQSAMRVRRVWLENFDLATLSVAVAEPDEGFMRETLATSALWTAAGFPDVGLAYYAMQTYTVGSIQIAANRRTASRLFGRDPKVVLTRARRMLAKRNATQQQRDVVEARFDEGDERYFEAGLRALVAGLLAGRP